MLGDLALEMELTKETILAIQNQNEISFSVQCDVLWVKFSSRPMAAR